MRQALLEDLTAIDWSVAWLAPYRQAGLQIGAALSDGATVAQALDRAVRTSLDPPQLCAGPLRFVAQAELPADQGYEAFIADTACVPTRDNLHDFFNGLAWLQWPALKRRLNELQAAQLAVRPAGSPRGAVRDALTLFDENAALLQLPPLLEQALRQRDWQALFVIHRERWADARVTLFGHALLEKLVAPRKPITAHGWLLPPELAADQLQAGMIRHLTPQRLASRSHHPLPVLGIPGWWPANQDAGFYTDPAVFRVRHETGAAAIIER